MTKRWGGVVRTVVGVAVLTVVLGGCFGEPGPIVTHDVTSTWTPPAVESPTPSPSPSPTATVASNAELAAAIGIEENCEDLECAKLVAEFYLLEYGPMFSTNDASRFEALSLPGCIWCEDSLEGAAEFAQAGEHFVGDADTIDPASWVYGYEGDTGNVLTQSTLTQGGGIVYGPDGEESGTVPRGRIVYETRMSFVDGFWRVADVDFEVVE